MAVKPGLIQKEDAMWTFEPSAALKYFIKCLLRKKVSVWFTISGSTGKSVGKTNGAITSIAMESGEVYKGKVFIDATYEGDLMAAAGVSYRIGRASNKEYGETLNGVQANKVSLTLGKNRIHKLCPSQFHRWS